MNDLKVSDIMCKWYIWAVVGYVIGKNLKRSIWGIVRFTAIIYCWQCQ